MKDTIDRTIAPSDTGAVPAFAVGLLSDVQVNEELFDYMEAVEATLHRFGGQWMSHGRTAETREGRLPGDIVIIGFPDLSSARAWYESDEYQAIIPLRARNSHSVVALVEGVSGDYSTHSTIQRMRAALAE